MNEHNTSPGSSLLSISDSIKKSLTAIPGIVQEPDFAAMQLEALVSQTEIVHRPEIALSISQNGKQFTLGTLGNFVVVTGKAKSRKSFFVHLLIAAALLQESNG